MLKQQIIFTGRLPIGLSSLSALKWRRFFCSPKTKEVRPFGRVSSVYTQEQLTNLEVLRIRPFQRSKTKKQLIFPNLQIF